MPTSTGSAGASASIAAIHSVITSSSELIGRSRLIFRRNPTAFRIRANATSPSGVAVYSSTYCGGWCVVGGTSVASPLLAGYVNNAGHFLASTNAELYKTYYLDSLNSLGYWYNPN